MINKKFNCESEFSSQKLAALKKIASSAKLALAKKYDCFEKVGILKK